MGNNKPNILVIAGGVLCLVSMLLGYVEFNAIVIKVPISWSNVARFVNNLLYAVPVVGLLMLLAGVVGNQAFQSVSAVAAVILCVWYLFVHRDILQGDAIRMLMGANTMLSQLIEGQGLTMEDISRLSAMVEQAPYSPRWGMPVFRRLKDEPIHWLRRSPPKIQSISVG